MTSLITNYLLYHYVSTYLASKWHQLGEAMRYGSVLVMCLHLEHCYATLPPPRLPYFLKKS